MSLNILVINPPNKPFTTPSILAEPIDVLQIASMLEQVFQTVTLVDMDYEQSLSLNHYLQEGLNILIFVYDYQIPLHTTQALENIYQILTTVQYSMPQYKGQLCPILVSKCIAYKYEELLEHGFKYLIQRNAETTLIKLIEQLISNGSIKDIPNLIYTQNGQVLKTGLEPIQDLSNFGKVNRNLLTGEYMKTKTLITSRGCVNKCKFCSTPYYFGKWQSKPLDVIYAEIQDLIIRGTPQILFLDDNFIVDKTRVLAICNYIEALHTMTKFGCLASLNCYDKEVFERMYEVGFRWVHLGIETLSQPLLRETLKPSIEYEKSLNVLKELKQMGYRIRNSYILDLPHTNENDLNLTFKFIKESNADEIRLHYLCYRYHTPLYSVQSNTKERQYIHSNKPNQYFQYAKQVQDFLHTCKDYTIINTDPDWETLEKKQQLNKVIAFTPIKYGLHWGDNRC